MIRSRSITFPRVLHACVSIAFFAVAASGQVQAQDGAWINQIIAASKSAPTASSDGASERASRAVRVKRDRPQPQSADTASTSTAPASLTGSGITWQATVGGVGDLP